MKKISFLALAVLLAATVHGQPPATYLHENFDAACVTSTGSASGWVYYNPPATALSSGYWTCTPTNGRASTPGMQCSNADVGGYALDTAYFISPLLNLSSYAPGRVFLNFDTKTTQFHNGGRIYVMSSEFADTPLLHRPGSYADLTAALVPIIDGADSTGWVTHQAELTSLETTGNFYIAFMYVGTAASGSTWFLDNVNTVQAKLQTDEIEVRNTALQVIGNSTSSRITLSYQAMGEGSYRVSICDMMGRHLYTGTVNATPSGVYTIDNLNLSKGMYLVKMCAGNNCAVTKAVVY